MVKVKKAKSSMWECECGNIENSALIPDECSECRELGKFIKVPKAVAEEIKERMLEEEDMI